MAALLAWLRSKSFTSHSVAAGAVFLAGLISTDQQVRDLMLTFFKSHPAIGTDIVALAAIVLKYSHSSSPAGAVAAAKVIEASPNAPTPAAVAAATPETK